MNFRPTDIKLEENNLLKIQWDDGKEHRLPIQVIRDTCPCATCREKRTEEKTPSNELNVLSLAETQPLRLLGIAPVGNYAYSINFSDGHDTGIFTLEFLRKLGEEILNAREDEKEE